MAKIKGLDANIELSDQYGVPCRISDITPKSQKLAIAKSAGTAKKAMPPRQIAEEFLKSIADDLDISVDPSHLRFDKVNRTILGRHVLFQQYHDGKPVSDAWIRVDLDRNDQVYNVQNDTVPMTVVQKSIKSKKAAAESPSLPDRAINIALKASKCDKSKLKEVMETQLVYYPYKGKPRLAWKIVLRGTQPKCEWKVYVDAEKDTVLEKINLLKKVKGKGKLFDPNPVIKLNDPTLKDSSPMPSGAYDEVDLADLDGTGFLDGKFVSTRRTSSRVKKTNNKFLLTRKDKGFKEVMCYFHIDRIQRYLQKLGFTNILNSAIEVDVDGDTDDNSSYSSLTKSLQFGTGGVDDAEDAEIILHEYGHAIQDAQVPGFGASHECGSMGEGFGDYLAGSFFEKRKAAQFKPCVGTWDAVAYSTDTPPCLRRLDGKKRYPADLDNEVHDDGEIWSACLWQLRTAIADPETADRLVIASHFLVTKIAKFKDAANALITADKNLNAGKHETAIRKIFVDRGILPKTKK
jgi:Zn-dependent metalloprotease